MSIRKDRLLNFDIPNHAKQCDGSESNRNCQFIALVHICKERDEGDENRCRIPDSGEQNRVETGWMIEIRLSRRMIVSMISYGLDESATHP